MVANVLILPEIINEHLTIPPDTAADDDEDGKRKSIGFCRDGICYARWEDEKDMIKGINSSRAQWAMK